MRNPILAKRLTDYAKCFMGTVYRYGTDKGRGDDPVRGFDCSGLVSEILRSVGILGNRDRLSAQMLFDHLKGKKPVYDPAGRSPKRGMLVFYGKDAKATHVAIAINDSQVIEAGGGSSETLDTDTASIRNAFVRIRPWNYRSDILSILDVCA